MSLSTLERPADIALPIEPISSPAETNPSKWRAVAALALSGLALSATLYYGSENTTLEHGGDPTPTMPAPRRDGTPEPIEPLITIPTQPTNLVELTSVKTPAPSSEVSNPYEPGDIAGRTPIASEDRAKPTLPTREPTPWTDYTTRGR